MQITFGKHKGSDITDIPLNYLKWGAANLSQIKVKEAFKQEIDRRENKPTTTYDPLIFGKNTTEEIVNITFEDNKIYLYKMDGTHEVINYKPWAIGKTNTQGATRLKGNQYYKYIADFNQDRYELLTQNRPRGVWFPRGIEEGFMLRHGYTNYKGMKLNQLSIVSFDIEATSLNPRDKGAEVILISNTYRDRNGKITKKLFDIHDYKSDFIMITEWNKWIEEINPDVMIGHNIFGYDLDYLAVRSSSGLQIGKDGRCALFAQKPSKFRKDGSQQYDYYNVRVHGRDVIDSMFLSIKYDIGRNFPSYGLKAIEKHLDLVDDSRIEWDFEKYPTKSYKEWPEGKWEEFKQYCRDDGDSPLKMFDIMMSPFFYLCQSVPKTLQQMINEASGSQLDSLMIRAYLQEGYSQPMTSQKEPFEGAISMGVPGVYDNVCKVDVASLYPSIMLQYNIYDKSKDPQRHMLGMLEYFRDQRLENKQLAKTTGEQYYDDMQAAQKIMINSMYGFMGAGYLLYNYPNGAAEVTRHGREILLKGVEWATGHTLKKVVKQIRNEGKENEEIKYEWVVGDKVTDGKGYTLVNVDTDSFSVTNGVRPTDDEFKAKIKDLNSIYPELIVWEDDGVFDKVIVVKAKNYVLVSGDKIKYKGSSLTDQKKEPILIGFLKECIENLLNNNKDNIPESYKQFCQQALNPSNINNWTVKKTITKPVLNPERANEQKVLDACNEAINKGVIGNIQEGDKVWLYQAIDGEKQKVTKGEPVFLKDGTPKMIENTILRFPQLFNGDHDKWHYVKRVYMTLCILENVIDIDKFEKYHLKSKRKLLESQ